MEAAPTEAKVDGVRVAVRVRPLNAREAARVADSPLDWRVGSTEIAQACAGRPVPANTFAFDHVFGQAATNSEVFSQLAQPVVAAALDGYNATIFAYGQTSSGKTHSMLGSEVDPGVTRRSIADVFERVRGMTDRQFLLRASYIEIYQEIIRDLLEPSHDNLKIHEDLNRRVYVEAREEVVSSVDEVMAMIAAGESVRAVGETQMNDRSSRSHTIFTLLIESREAVSGEVIDTDAAVVSVGDDGAPAAPLSNGVAVRASSLSLVDLAGSERAALTGAEGLRLKEGSHINKSLLTLGNVINKLSSAEPGSTAHIPYRDSKLTRILQPALGGNARTAILCAVTPAIMHMDETLSTLKFASRAKKVKNRTQCNEYLDDTAKLRRCERQLAKLKKQLAAVQCGSAALHSDVSVEAPSLQVSTTAATEEAVVAAAEHRVRAFRELFEKMVADKAFATTKGELNDGRQRPSSLTARDALDLALRPRCAASSSSSGAAGGDAAGDCPQLSDSAETEIAGLRRSVFAAEQAQTRMQAEIEYERSAWAAELEMLSEVAEEKTRSQSAAEDECSMVRTALARANASAYVNEVVTASMLMSDSEKTLRAAKARISFLEPMQSKFANSQEKLKAVEKELSEARKREKRGVGPVLKEVNALKSKLADSENKLKSSKQASSKTSSEKAGLEKEMIAKGRQIKVLETELQKYRKHESNANARTKGEIAAERKKWELAKADMDAQAASLKENLAVAENAADELQVAVGKLEATAVMLTDEKEKLERDLVAEQQQLVHFRAEMGSEMGGLRENFTASERTVEQLQSTVAKLEDETKAKNGKISALEEEAVKVKAELAEAENRMQESDSSLSTLKSELVEITKNASSAEVAAAEKIEELEKAVICGNQNVEQAKKQADELGAELASLHMSTETVKAEQLEYQRLLDETKAKNGKISALEEEAVKVKAELAEAENRMQESDSSLSTLKSELVEITKNASSAEVAAAEKIEELEKAVICGNQNVEQAKKQADELGAELASLHMSTETVKAEQLEYQRLLEETQASEKELEGKTAALETEILDLQALAKQFEKSTGELKKELDDTLNKKLKLESDLSASRAKGQEVADEAQTGATSAAAQIEEVNERLKACQTDLSVVQAERDDAQRRVQALSEKVNGVTAASCGACIKLAVQIEEMREVHKMASQELKQQKEEVRHARRTLETENQRLAACVAKESSVGSQLLEKVYSRDGRINELENKLAEYRRGGGAIRRLEEKLQRRDATLQQCRSVLDANVALIKEGGLGGQWSVLERAASAEAELETLKTRLKECDATVARLEERETAGQDERRKLRQEIKARDLASSNARAERLQHALKEKQANTG